MINLSIIVALKTHFDLPEKEAFITISTIEEAT